MKTQTPSQYGRGFSLIYPKPSLEFLSSLAFAKKFFSLPRRDRIYRPLEKFSNMVYNDNIDSKNYDKEIFYVE